VSPSPSALRAIEWLERQRADLGGIRNATCRDPIFKNWRQVTLTAIQRAWPGDRARLERFLRIPFSPVDPRADMRVQREWYSRGCQEAERVLGSYVEDIRAHGVPEVPDEEVTGTGGVSGEFEVDFPTVDLPAGDLGASAPSSGETRNPFADFVDSSPQAGDARDPTPPPLPRAETPAPGAPGTTSAAGTARPARKGLNMRARLMDLLGFSQLSAKAASAPTRETPSSASLPSLDLPATTLTQPARGLDIVPLGGAVAPPPSAPPAEPLEVTATEPPPAVGGASPAEPPADGEPGAAPRPSGSWPLPRSAVVAADASSRGGTPARPATPPVPTETSVSAADEAPPAPSAVPDAGPAPAHEPGVSVVMSRPTTLRGAIEKVSIESLLSDQFRGSSPSAPGSAPSDDATRPAAGSSAAMPAGPAVPVAAVPAAAIPPAPVEPVEEAPVPPAPAAAQEADADRDTPAEIEMGAPVEELLSATGSSGPAAAPAPTEEEEAPMAPRSRILQLPRRRAAKPEPLVEGEGPDSAVGRVDPEAFARATEDFMKSSPVLGATGRRVKRARDPERDRERERGRDESAWQDPDAIAIAAMVDDLDDMKVPPSRRNETRARLKDLAARIEKGELEWPVLKKAVWFAMEHPELARRLVPVLLPWFDRAA
jgi:hypothetical protein